MKKLNFTFNFDKRVKAIRLLGTYVYGKPSPYSNGEGTKQKTFYLMLSFKKIRWTTYKFSLEDYYFLGYHNFDEIQLQILDEMPEIDYTNFISEIMRRTKYQIPIQMVRESQSWYDL